MKTKKHHKVVYYKVREGSLCELFLPTRLLASGNRRLAKNANPIPRERGDGFADAHRIGKIKIGVLLHSYFYFGDPYGNRTHVFSVRG